MEFLASANFAIDRMITSGISATQTTMTLVDASEFPDPAVSGQYDVVIWDSTLTSMAHEDPSKEIVTVVAKSGNTLEITRAVDGTIARDHNTSGRIYAVALVFNRRAYELLTTAITQRSFEQLGGVEVINLAVTGTTSVYTNTTSNTTVVLMSSLYVNSASTPSGTPEVGIGYNDAGDNIFNPRELTGVGAIGDIYTFIQEGKSLSLPPGETLYVSVPTALDSGEMTAQVTLFGKSL